jgi:integrase/recombinase XerD
MCGLRCGELLALQPSIDSKRNLVLLKSVKKRSHYPIIANFRNAAEYYLIHKPMKYLFEGQIKGQPYDARSLQLILKQAQKSRNHKTHLALVATQLCDTLTRKWYRFTLHSRIISHSSSKTTEITRT